MHRYGNLPGYNCAICLQATLGFLPSSVPIPRFPPLTNIVKFALTGILHPLLLVPLLFTWTHLHLLTIPQQSTILHSGMTLVYTTPVRIPAFETRHHLSRNPVTSIPNLL